MCAHTYAHTRTHIHTHKHKQHTILSSHLLLTILHVSTGTVAEGAPIIPISAQLKYNIEVVCEYITKKVPIPKRDFMSPPRLIGEL